MSEKQPTRILPCSMIRSEAGPGHRDCPLCHGTGLLEFDPTTGTLKSSTRRQGDEFYVGVDPEKPRSI